MIGATSTPLVASRVISWAVKAPRAGHLGAPGLCGVDGLVCGQGPALRHVAVTDRVPVLGEVGRDRLLQVEPCEPEPRSSVRGDNPYGRTARKRQLVTGCDGAERLVATA